MPGKTPKIKQALEKLTSWIVDDGECRLGQFIWQPNRMDDVYLDYPVVKIGDDQSIETCLDEIFVGSEVVFPRGKIPTYGELKSKGYKPDAFIHMVCFHKGSVVYGFQVVDKSKMNIKKTDIITDYAKQAALQMFEINADWILGQEGRPTELMVKQVC